MSISKIEQETVILFNEAEANASVYTYNGTLKRKPFRFMQHAGRKKPGRPKMNGSGGLTFEVPKRW